MTTENAVRVLVTGSRGWPHPDQVVACLVDQWVAAPSGRPFVVVHGACFNSPDLIAADWADRMREGLGVDVSQEPHRPDWIRDGSGAGFARNQLMVELGASLCLAFASQCQLPRCREPRPHDTHGTADCILRAARAGIHVEVHRSWSPPARPTEPTQLEIP